MVSSQRGADRSRSRKKPKRQLGCVSRVLPHVTDDPGKELKFVHITKNAGTALEKWGVAHGFSWGKHWPALREAIGPKGSKLLAPQTGKMRSEPWHLLWAGGRRKLAELASPRLSRGAHELSEFVP